MRPVTEPWLIQELEVKTGREVDPQLAAELDRQATAEREYVPIPQPLPEPAQTPAGRPATTMGGAMLGMGLGAPAGPVGAAAGGVLGAGIGSMGFDTGVDIGKAAGVLSPKTPTLGPGERSMEAARQMAYEAGGQGVGQAIGAPIGRMIGNRATGIRTAAGQGAELPAQVGTEAQQQALLASKHGIDVGLADVSPRAWVKGWAKVVGRFPFVGTPFKEAAAAKAQQAGGGLDKIVSKWGPSVSLAKQGVNLNTAATNSFKSFRDEAAGLYKVARAAGNEAGAVIPSQPIKAAVQDISKNSAARWRVLQETSEGTKAVPTTPVQPDEVGVFLKEAAKIEDNLTAAKLDTFLDDVQTLMGRSRAQGWDIARLAQVKAAAESALRSPEVAQAAPGLAKAVGEADGFFSKGMRTFETPTAQKFGRVTKGGFKVGLNKPGTFNEDELFSLAWNDKSAASMRDLRKLVGKETFEQSLHTHLRSVYNQSAASTGYLGRLNADLEDGQRIVDPDRFLSRLGLKQPGSAEFDALTEAVRGTGITPEALKDFAGVIKTAFSSEVPDVSTFIARRATLGGAKSLIRGLAGPGGAVIAGGGLTAGVAGSPFTAAGITILTRHMGTVLTDPKKLRLFTNSLRQSLPFQQRRASMVRLLRMIPDVWDDDQ